MNDPEGISGMFWTFANDTFSVSGEWNAPYGGSGGFNVGENADLAKNQILQQASTAMLAKANASKQNVRSLLQG